jgi:histidyl-tRNA synthetase
MTLSKKPYKGTRDFFPAQKRAQDFLFSHMTDAALSFGYEHYDGPLLEEVALYMAKSGEELINEQIYSFEDRGNRKMAIRPEMTPTVARMVAQIHKEVSKPLRWFSIPNLMRYERPQRGRLREHWQFNCDIFGAPGRSGEVEIIQVAIELLQSFGANQKHFEILINDREVVEAIFSKISEDPEVVYKLFKLVDKAKKIPQEALDKELMKLNLSEESQKIFNQYMGLTSFEELFQIINQLGLGSAADSFQEFFTSLIDLDMSEFVKFDPTIVRGLDYYTGIVFEIFDKHPDNRRAICGGGAYANLLKIFNEQPLPGVGFGLGDVTLNDFLVSHGLMPDLSIATNDILISFQTDKGLIPSMKIAKQLRLAGLKTLTHFDSLKINKLFSLAQKKGANYVTILGDEEIENGQVLIKNLASKTQVSFSQNEYEKIIDHIKDNQ